MAYVQLPTRTNGVDVNSAADINQLTDNIEYIRNTIQLINNTGDWNTDTPNTGKYMGYNLKNSPFYASWPTENTWWYADVIVHDSENIMQTLTKFAYVPDLTNSVTYRRFKNTGIGWSSWFKLNLYSLDNVKILTGTAPAQGLATSITHYIDRSKILNVFVEIFTATPGQSFTSGFTYPTGYEFGVLINDYTLEIYLTQSNSFNIVGKQIKATITYQG